MDNGFVVGDIVANYPSGFEGFYLVARVVEILEPTSMIVREIGGRDEWVADPAKCRIAR